MTNRTVIACTGICVDPNHIKGLTYQLLTIAESRKKIIFDNPCHASRKLVEEQEIKTVSSLVVSLAIYTRLWFERFESDEGITLPNPVVVKRLDKNKKDKLKAACSFIAHISGMWFLPCDDECSGDQLIFDVPKEQDSDEMRTYSLDIRAFCCGINDVIDTCPDCSGTKQQIEIDENGIWIPPATES